MSNLRNRIEFLSNGVTITNRATGNKEMSPNTSRILEYVKSHVSNALENGEPGEYYDIDVTVTKQKLKKPTS